MATISLPAALRFYYKDSSLHLIHIGLMNSCFLGGLMNQRSHKHGLSFGYHFPYHPYPRQFGPLVHRGGSIKLATRSVPLLVCYIRNFPENQLHHESSRKCLISVSILMLPHLFVRAKMKVIYQQNFTFTYSYKRNNLIQTVT